MKSLEILVAAAIAVFSVVTAPRAEAQISIRIGIELNCPYGYYDYSPYGSAPYGY